ncbi:MAG: hypothetical protein A3D92_22355 [Bacteroidetes bacterium RIFCSPHIGHO2_02_FULL_44_7]|nr:MAG: hypothetical protein A3D92_22355 [Bacteroidetes bacterium RIFCSPHIGHO2_02_FULL_44_7]
MLKNKKVDWVKKLLALVSLAQMASRDSLRILESYCRNPDPQMKTYARLALAEAAWKVDR